jgi:O-antigen ligase
VSGILSGAGVLIAAGASVAAMLLPSGRLRALAMLAAIGLCPVVILGDQWHSAEIVDLRNHPVRLVLLGVLALVLTAALALVFRRRPIAFPLAVVAALPFRVPLEAGGDTANLLVPLYLVIAGGVVAIAVKDWAPRPRVLPWGEGGTAGGPRSVLDPPPPTPPAEDATRPVAARWLPRILATVVLLYAVQALYSPDFSRSLQNVCFFFVPFSLLFGLLRDVEWSRKLLVWALRVVAIEAVAFVLIGSIEWATRELFWNGQVIRSNDFHTYFRVNSVFWDPNIYGRYLALAIVVAMAALLWAKNRRSFWLLTGLVVVLWLGLVPTYSQSSFFALLAGLAVLAALRWSLKWTLATLGMGAVAAVLFVALAGGSLKIDFSKANEDTSGRANLVSGGIELFKQRPIWGYGSGSFPKAYTEHVRTNSPVSVSHTEPITVAAEQGLVGLALYAALLAVALWTMSTGLHGSMPGLSVPRAPELVGRAAVLAAFTALLVHTMAYAGFFEDPIAWVLLAAATSLAAVPVRDAT